ncbi:hypothetical protein [Fulvivirga lutimaris]|uniref:hypothetical protein n=1 Tax=Fulvivirga lutimaris TaxID=1819566 RepID=UPI0012BD7E4C|nr:hypothetical protein [Fulvivirga lutimaris]MTI41966.1 hypothetical protein [Fulvivirga lutimaris]
MYQVKFELKYEPTDLKQIAKWPYWFGITLLLLVFLIISISTFLPLDLLVVYLFEIIGEFTLHLLAIGIFSTLTGHFLDKLSWRRGQLKFDNECIDLVGKKSVNIPFDTILSILRADSSKRVIHINTTHYNAKFKFELLRDFKTIKALLDQRIAMKVAA